MSWSLRLTNIHVHSHASCAQLHSHMLFAQAFRLLFPDAASAPICCLFARQAHHITLRPTHSRTWLRLWSCLLFHIYIHSFSFIIPQLATLYSSHLCKLWYEPLLFSLLTVPTESTLSPASVPYAITTHTTTDVIKETSTKSYNGIIIADDFNLHHYGIHQIIKLMIQKPI
jgi:hypothetical protein